MRRWGDRKDAVRVRDLDAMHMLMPLFFLSRCDNEAYISERIDLTAINAYLEDIRDKDPEYKYNMFQIIVTAVLKAITLRPKMNRFIANKIMYERNTVSASFIIKKMFTDEAEEGIAFVYAKPEDTLESIHNEIKRQVMSNKDKSPEQKGKKDPTSAVMDVLCRLPHFVLKMIFALLRFLDRRGLVPDPLIETDPQRASVMFSNLGSIKLNSGYHHLSNWGTNSLFVIIGEKKLRPYYDAEGNITMKDSVDIGITVDERIGDGYYFAKTLRLIRKLLQDPSLLERPLGEEIEY
ncbi:MAG: hypothetical protein IKE56_06100 [Lachnospiraceae bacterium]|nr:hypothetical protein [Lachnospiraceae bacterium]